MITKTVAACLWNELQTWEDSNYLVRVVCLRHAETNAPSEPKYSSIIRIAGRLKKQPRFQARLHALRQEIHDTK